MNKINFTELRDKAVVKWNADIPRIEGYIKSAGDLPHNQFMWDTIVWQEILMYMMMERPVEFEDFQFIVDRRGLDENMKNYLKEMLIFLGIGNYLNINESVENPQTAAVLRDAEKRAQLVEKGDKRA
jgi:hypothetical protein